MLLCVGGGNWEREKERKERADGDGDGVLTDGSQKLEGDGDCLLLTGKGFGLHGLTDWSGNELALNRKVGCLFAGYHTTGRGRREREGEI